MKATSISQKLAIKMGAWGATAEVKDKKQAPKKKDEEESKVEDLPPGKKIVNHGLAPSVVAWMKSKGLDENRAYDVGKVKDAMRKGFLTLPAR